MWMSCGFKGAILRESVRGMGGGKKVSLCWCVCLSWLFAVCCFGNFTLRLPAENAEMDLACSINQDTRTHNHTHVQWHTHCVKPLALPPAGVISLPPAVLMDSIKLMSPENTCSNMFVFCFIWTFLSPWQNCLFEAGSLTLLFPLYILVSPLSFRISLFFFLKRSDLNAMSLRSIHMWNLLWRYRWNTVFLLYNLSMKV